MLERVTSTTVPPLNIRVLARAYANAANNQTLKDLLASANDEALKVGFVKELKDAIQGTPKQALIVDTIALFTSATATVAISPAVNSMTNLGGALKNVLISAPSVSGSLLMLPVGIQFDKTGGLKEVLALRCVAILGMLGLTTLASFTDLSTVDHFDYRYGAMLGLNLLIGTTLPSFLSMTNIIHWYPIKNIGHASSVYGGFGSLAPGIFLLTLQLSLNQIGLPLSFGLSASVLAFGTGIMAKYFHVPPYHQLRKLDLPHNQSVAIASLVGQDRFPLPPDTDYGKLIRETITDFRAASLAAASSSYGIFLASTISTYITLIEILKLTPTQAVTTTAVGSIWATIVKGLIGTPIDKYDTSGGAYTYCLGSLPTVAGSLMMATARPLPSFAYTACAQGLIFTGAGASSLASLVLSARWADPDNGYSRRLNNGTLGGILATVGQLWGMALPLSTAAFVFDEPKEGYQNFFYLTACLAAFASVMVMLGHKHLQTPLQTSFANCWAGTFRRDTTGANNVELSELPEVDVEKAGYDLEALHEKGPAR